MLNPKKDNIENGFLIPEYPFKFPHIVQADVKAKLFS